jgi:hypothetical protein
MKCLYKRAEGKPMSIFDQQRPTAFDPGPSIEDIDRDLRDVSDATLARYVRDLDWAQIGSKHWEALPLEQRKAMRANNELAKRQRQQEQAAAKAAEDARVEAAHSARMQAEIEAYKQQVRGAWIGDQASFDAAFPKMLEQWQIDRARAATEANIDRIRARIAVDF